MKYLLVLCGVIAAVLAQEKYTDKYDNTNVAEILENPKLFESYVNCLMDTGKCTAEGNELKGHIKDALETECSKCTEKQKEKTTEVFDYVIKNNPDTYYKLTAKYDPDRTWRNKYEEEAKKRGITLPA